MTPENLLVAQKLMEKAKEIAHCNLINFGFIPSREQLYELSILPDHLIKEYFSRMQDVLEKSICDDILRNNPINQSMEIEI